MPLEQFLRKSYKAQSNTHIASLKNAGNTGIKGAWSGSELAPSMRSRGVTVASAQIKPTGLMMQASEIRRVRKVEWQYGFLPAAPPYLQAYLCNAARCAALGSGSGSTDRFNGDNANSNFVFAFVISGKGALLPAIRGEKLRLVVSYE
ncbi:flagellar protein FlhE [Glaciimonas soli]|nr:flagellar protein FlhE [Glaciimonas soli]